MKMNERREVSVSGEMRKFQSVSQRDGLFQIRGHGHRFQASYKCAPGRRSRFIYILQMQRKKQGSQNTRRIAEAAVT
jgi:hypothetical protein